MANVYTTDILINDIILLAHVPLSTNTSAANPYSPTNILRLATIEIQTPITKQILSTRGNYYKTYIDLPTSGTGLYPIPPQAISGAMANIELIQGPTIIPVNLISESEQFSTLSPTSTSYGFFMVGNMIQILPIPNIGNCRIWYYQRTSELCQTSQAAQSTVLATNVITVSSVPSGMDAGSIVDTVQDQPPFNVLDQGLIVLSVVGNVITLDSAPSALMLPGDWITFTGKTPVPQIPVEFRILLAQRVSCKIYEAQLNWPKLKIARETLASYETDTFGLITTRVSDKGKVINPINGGVFSGNINRLGNFPTGREM